MLCVKLNNNLEPKKWETEMTTFAGNYRSMQEQNNKQREKMLKEKSHWYSPPEEMFDLLTTSLTGPINDYAPTENHFINAVLLAYNNHVGLTFSADDLLVVIAQAVANTVNAHSEEMRHLFVDHAGQKKLVIKSDGSKHDPEIWKFFFSKMEKAVSEMVKTDLQLTPDFTTSTPVTRLVSSLTTMATFKKYFSYGFELSCGIPHVTLLGSQEDWNELVAKYAHVKKVFQANGFKYLDNWFVAMDVILQAFVDMRGLAEKGTVEATPELQDFWSRVVTYVPHGSGGQKYLSGWSQLLFPTEQMPARYNLLDPQSKPPERDNNYYAWQDKLKAWAQVCRDNSGVPHGLAQCPAELNNYGEITKLNLNAGFIASAFDSESGSVWPVLGYFVTETKS